MGHWRDITVTGIAGPRLGQTGLVSVWPVFDRQDWVNVAWQDGTIETARAGEIEAVDEAGQLARRAAAEARYQQLAKMPKFELAAKHRANGGLLSHKEYLGWSKGELVAAVMEDEGLATR